MIPVVFIRHGQSVWNEENRFTGWTDVGLTALGQQEAIAAGNALAGHGFRFDEAFTSFLSRAIDTLQLIKDTMGLSSLPTTRAWQLNERHYGALQGLNKQETAQKYGAEQVHQWRRGYAIRPPAIEYDDTRHPRYDERYQNLSAEQLPAHESLQDTMARAYRYWQDTMVPKVREGQRLLVVAHGNSLRALVKGFDRISDEQITQLDIPTGKPLVYEFDDGMNAVHHYYLGEQKQVAFS